jgi:hypothetical protein
MLDYLLAVLIAPLLRRLLRLCLRVMAISLLVTIPAKLWLRYMESRPSDEALMAVNAAGLALVLIIGSRRCGRRH